MTAPPISGVYNDAYIAQLFEAFRRDPNSVDASWRQFFSLAQALGGESSAAAAPPQALRIAAGAAALVQAIRHYGHLSVAIDPLGSAPLGAQELTPEFHGIREADLETIPGSALGFNLPTAADVVRLLRRRYIGAIGFEVTHLPAEQEREWFRHMLRDEKLTRPLTPEERRAVLTRLSEVEGLERFLGRVYQGRRRFSIEGGDALVPMLDAAIDESARGGAREVVIGMSHRGRLNVLTHVLGKPVDVLFREFEGIHADGGEDDTGDVKYHMGYRGERTLADGTTMKLLLAPNPSHLEFVNPVISGVARAHQRVGVVSGVPQRDERAVLSICVHGDAAFIGEGVVAETFNMSRLPGYRVGGTLHIIVNNQVGFTTDPSDARSTHYASDLAKGFDVPIVHVNADDAEACIIAVRIGIAYRERFGKDFLIDLVGYRRHGHNETDEPAYTQPMLYAAIKSHPTARAIWGSRLVAEGILSTEDVDAAERAVTAQLEKVHDGVKVSLATGEHPVVAMRPPQPRPVETAVPPERLVSLNERLLTWPDGFSAHRNLVRTLERRRAALGDAGGIDWGHAEALALASLLADGVSIRISGQDVQRGTFSHRQSVLHDGTTGATYMPLSAIGESTSAIEIINSPLSETSVLGFEYGYSTAAEDTLVLWEAQFGDFANTAAPIIDQFLAADHAKWHQDSSLVLLLPHGYEGQGPEHSSARLERFLQLCAEGNMTVAYPSTAAQYFHVLRRQGKRQLRRPLVLMQPKSMLRLPAATSSIGDLTKGSFRAVIDDPTSDGRRDEVKRMVFCTGKIYHEIAAAAAERGAREIAVVRVEELYAWPHDEIARIVDSYANVTDVVWAQEEPKNSGAWSYAAPRMRGSIGNVMTFRYIGRPERASPAEGYESSHKAEQDRIINDVLELPKSVQSTKRRVAARS